uniref:SCP2 domain-containing protein n=1 Tax=Anopheles coluzzii TaxID=1518534 RepID=A0A8W7PPU3_ANOCL
MRTVLKPQHLPPNKICKMALKSDPVFERIAKRLESIDPNNRQVQQVYKFRIQQNGTVVKTWVLDLKAVKLTEGDGPAEATLTMEDDIMFALGTGAMPAKEALAQDKLDVEGQVELIFLLEPFIASLKK